MGDMFTGTGIESSVTHLTWAEGVPASNVQKIAREQRYEALGGLARQHNIKHILTGHHLDDQVRAAYFFL